MLSHSEIEYHPKERLHLHEDIPGAKIWAVVLEPVMLTNFEVQPHCRYESTSTQFNV